jgi:hypothetical protein
MTWEGQSTLPASPPLSRWRLSSTAVGRTGVEDAGGEVSLFVPDTAWVGVGE